MKPKTKGILLILASAFSFSLMSVCVLMAGDNIPFFQKALFRNGMALIVASATLVASKESLYVTPACRLPLLSRVLCGVVSVFCNFYAIDKLILANSNSLNKLAPFFSIFLAAIFLKEKVNRRQVLCIVVAFLGSLFIIVPGLRSATLGLPVLIALMGGVSGGGTQASLRAIQQAGHIPTAIVVFAFSLSTTLATLVPSLLAWTPMTLRQVLFLVLAGTVSAFGQYSVTLAYRYAAPKEISIYDFSQIIFSGMLGFFIFGQIPSASSFVAYALIVAASLLLLRSH